MKTHTIHWRSLSNGRIGMGTYLFEKEEAERLAAELNRDYPDIHHEPVEVQPQQTSTPVLVQPAASIAFPT